jgi:hypothetical protein
MHHFPACNHRHQSMLIAIGLPLIVLALLIAPNASARSIIHAPVNGVICFASLGVATDYSSADASAVQQAVDATSAGGIVKVAGTCAGVQARSSTTQTVIITKSLTLQGGYTTTNWITSDLGLNPTTLDAQGAGRVIFASAALTVSDLTVQNGKWTVGIENGGGIYAGQPITLRHVILYNNIVTGANGGGSYSNGGAAYFADTASVTASTFISNTAGDGSGGGADFERSASVNATAFTSNTAGFGAGAYFSYYSPGYVNASTFTGNTASHGGGGALFGSMANVNVTTFTGNTSADIGGGAWFKGTADVRATSFTSNTAIGGGGAFFGGLASVTASTFTSNTALTDSGGGASFGLRTSVVATTFTSNTAKYFGGGAYFGGPTSVIASTFTGNTVIGDGGGASFRGYSTASVNATTFTRNTASNGGGGAYFFSLVPASVAASTFTSNTANFGGGVVFGANFGTTSSNFVNTLFTANTAESGQGAALYALNQGDTVTLRHTTIASPTIGGGSAVYMFSGTLNLTNTIVASYSIGIDNAGGSVYEDYNLFFGNTISKTGSISGGGHDVSGDPKFLNPGTDDYHLITGSAAINAGVNAGVYTDLDGKFRPIGGGFDIGTYEYGTVYKIYLPLVMKNS